MERPFFPSFSSAVLASKRQTRSPFPDQMPLENNLIDKAWDVFERVQRQNAAPSPDEVSFVGGFIACFGIITGKVDIGLDQSAPLTEHLDALHRSIADFAGRITENQRKQAH